MWSKMREFTEKSPALQMTLNSSGSSNGKLINSKKIHQRNES